MLAETRDKNSTGRLILGLSLIAIGAAYYLDRAGHFEASNLWDYAPIALVVAGLGKLLRPASGSGRLVGFVIAFIGFALLSENLGLFAFDPWDLWPVILVVAGVALVVDGGRHRSVTEGSSVDALAVLGGASRVCASSDFRGGDLAAFMGGCEIDLRSAQIVGGPAVIDAFAFWGGIELKVPKNWEVIVKGVPLLGSYEDNTELEGRDREGPDDEFLRAESWDDDSFRRDLLDDLTGRQQLVVKGFAIMGGVEVRN